MSLRNVIYYNSSNDQISLAGIAQLPYTDVIIANLQPADAADNNFTLAGWGNAFDNNLQSNIQALQSAGKNVLISFGGANNANLLSGYQSYAQNVGALVDDIVNNWVLAYGFNGVDIDYEDDSGFDQPGQSASYDGARFLVALTNGLYQSLPSGQNIITHAPSPPFFDPQGGYYAANTQTPAYTQIWQQAGNQIAWINCQFYDNSDYDATAALKVSWYQQIAEIMGAPQQLLMGVSLDTSPDGDEGAETLTDVVQNVIPPLEAQFGSQFGGVMAWEFSLDQGGAWANGIAQALGASATPNLYVFRQGSGNDGQLRYSVFQDTNWGGDTLVPNLGMSESPAAVAWAGGITVFHQGLGDNGQLWYTYSPIGENLGGDTQVQNVSMSGSPSAVVYNGDLYAFHQGLGFNGQLCYSIFDGANWSADGCLNLGMSGSPSAVLWKGGITVFHQGTGHNGQLRYTSSPDGTDWDGDTQVQNVGMSGSPSAVVYNGLLYVFHQGSGNDGTLRYSVFDGTNWSADTPIPNVGIWSSGSPSAALWKGGITVFHQAANSNLLMYTYSPDGKQWGADTSVNVAMSGSPSCVVV